MGKLCFWNRKKRQIKVSNNEYTYSYKNPLESIIVTDATEQKLIKKLNKKLKGKRGAREALNFSKIKNVKVIEKKFKSPKYGGYVRNKKTIVINKDMPEGEKFWSTTHELQHIKNKDSINFNKKRAILDTITAVEARRELATKREIKKYLCGTNVKGKSKQ